MAELGLTAEPGFLLLMAALYYLGGGAAATAFFTAALAHELGHLTVLWLLGASVQELRLQWTGLVIRYTGALTPRQEAGTALAGPAAGLLFSLGCALSDRPYFHYAGAIAILASAFNLLPCLPMDGGRAALYIFADVMPERTARRVLRVLGTLCALGVTATGIAIRVPTAVAAGIWMCALANSSDLLYNRSHENER